MTNRPLNFIVFQADQLAARALSAYGNNICKTPELNKIVAQGTVFQNSYANYPLCGPSRASMMSGLMPFQGGFYDNRTEYPSIIPSFAHYLRSWGIRHVSVEKCTSSARINSTVSKNA